MTQEVLKKATDYCEEHKHRLTEPRIEVLKIISASTKPLGAYEVLEELGKTIKNPKPPTAYRAIEFWQKHGFVHRIESMNAYVACKAGHQHKGSQFLICEDCGTVTEAHLCSLPQSLKDTTAKSTFKPARWNFEIYGTCEQCS